MKNPKNIIIAGELAVWLIATTVVSFNASAQSQNASSTVRAKVVESVILTSVSNDFDNSGMRTLNVPSCETIGESSPVSEKTKDTGSTGFYCDDSYRTITSDDSVTIAIP